jgi:hypothetical protein
MRFLTVITLEATLRGIVTVRRKRRATKPKPGDKVVLKALPSGFIDDLPEDEQRAISARIGRPIMLMGYDRDGRAELEFMAQDDLIHTLYVGLKFIRPWVKLHRKPAKLSNSLRPTNGT